MTTTTPKATAARTILALDLGKYKTVACACDPATAQARFDALTTSREHLRKLFARERPAAVVIEACLLAGWVHDLCHELGLPCHVANTASEAWKFKHQKRKTDKDDALCLAQLFALGQLPTVTVPPPATRQWRALIASRQALVGRRVAVQNRVRAILVGQGLPAPRGPRPGPSWVWRASASTPGRWPSAAPTSCGGGCSTDRTQQQPHTDQPVEAWQTAYRVGCLLQRMVRIPAGDPHHSARNSSGDPRFCSFSYPILGVRCRCPLRFWCPEPVRSARWFDWAGGRFSVHSFADDRTPRMIGPRSIPLGRLVPVPTPPAGRAASAGT